MFHSPLLPGKYGSGNIRQCKARFREQPPGQQKAAPFFVARLFA